MAKHTLKISRFLKYVWPFYNIHEGLTKKVSHFAPGSPNDFYLWICVSLLSENWVGEKDIISMNGT